MRNEPPHLVSYNEMWKDNLLLCLPAVLLIAWWCYETFQVWRQSDFWMIPLITIGVACMGLLALCRTLPECKPCPLWQAVMLALLGAPFLLAASFSAPPIIDSRPSRLFALSAGTTLYFCATFLFIGGWRTLGRFFIPAVLFFSSGFFPLAFGP